MGAMSTEKTIELIIDSGYIVHNYDDLPENKPEGRHFVFRFMNGDNDIDAILQCTDDERGLSYCRQCVFDTLAECPWDPYSGSVLCDMYRGRFIDVKYIMEEL